MVSDGCMGILWLGVNALLGVSSYRLGTFAFRDDGASVRLMGAITVFLFVILFSTILLGAMGILNYSLLLGLVACIAAITLVAVAPDKTHSKMKRAASVTTTAPKRRRPVMYALWSVLAAFGVSHAVMSGLLQFPTDFDSLMYHLPIIDQWLQAESLYALNSSYWWTPGTSEVIGMWMVLPFSGDFLAALNNIPFVALWVVSSYCFSREMRLPSAWANLAALGSVLVYSTFDELNDGKNDLAIVALFLTGATFGLRFLNNSRNADLCFFALVLGGLCGVKYNAIGYTALLVAAVMGICVLERQIGTAFKVFLVSALGVLALGGYWYIRNWVIGRSPIYPMGLGHDIATAYPDVWKTTLAGNGDPRVGSLALGALWKMTGPVHLVAVVLSPFLLTYFLVRAFVFGNVRGNRANDSHAHVFMAMLLLGSGTLLLITPFCVEDQPGSLNHLKWAYTPVRYGLCFLSIAVLAMVKFLFDVWRSRAQRWERLVRSASAFSAMRCVTQWLGCRKTDLAPIMGLLGLITWQFILRLRYSWGDFNFVDTGLLSLNLLTAGMVLQLLVKRFSMKARVGVAMTFCVLLVFGITLLSARWHDGFGPHYDKHFGVTVFSQASNEKAVWKDRVGVLDLRVYPFFGSRRQTEVARARVVESSEDLTEYIQKHDLQFVATHAHEKRKYFLYSNNYNWLKSDPMRYSMVYARGAYAVFAVRDSASPSKALTPE